jgi:hypothetical protein
MMLLTRFLIRCRWQGFQTREQLRLHNRAERAGHPSCAHVHQRHLGWLVVLALAGFAGAPFVPAASQPSRPAQLASASTTTRSKRPAPVETDRWYTQAGHSIVNRTDKPLVPNFDSCRENEKQHVSCQYTDADGKAHWVYLPGLTWAQISKK